MSLPIRNSIKILLLNDKKEILLMCADDPKTTTLDGKYNGKFWFAVGGQIENGESMQEAAIREIYEETGLGKEEIELGPIVWFGEFDLSLNGILTHMKQTFMVVKTNNKNVVLTNLDEWEKKKVKRLKWFSLEEIIHSDEVIYPVVLPQYLPSILKGKYPKKPIEIDLGKQPSKK